MSNYSGEAAAALLLGLAATHLRSAVSIMDTLPEWSPLCRVQLHPALDTIGIVQDEIDERVYICGS